MVFFSTASSQNHVLYIRSTSKRWRNDFGIKKFGPAKGVSCVPPTMVVFVNCIKPKPCFVHKKHLKEVVE
jgi:hypothetical protein